MDYGIPSGKLEGVRVTKTGTLVVCGTLADLDLTIHVYADYALLPCIFGKNGWLIRLVRK